MIGRRELRLAAWMDGAMSPEDAATFEAEMAEDPDLAAQALRWRANDALIVSTLPLEADLSVEPALLERLGLADPTAQPPAVAANDNPHRQRRFTIALGGMIAACFAIFVFVLSGTERHQEDALSNALETTPSGVQAKLPDGRTIAPVLTVRARDGRYCREYQLAARDGLACRDGGRWQVEDERDSAKPEGNAGDYRLAAGADPHTLAAAYRLIGASDPLSQAQETALIWRKWRNAK